MGILRKERIGFGSVGEFIAAIAFVSHDLCVPLKLRMVTVSVVPDWFYITQAVLAC